MSARCRIQMLGALAISVDERVVTRFRTRKCASLAAYLALDPGRARSRESLIELLWPDCGIDAGRHNLSMALSFLRPILEPPGLLPDGSVLAADRDAVSLRSGAVTTDVADFEAALAEPRASDRGPGCIDRLSRATALYGGEFLPGHYEDWVIAVQERLREMYFQATHRLVEALEDAGDTDRAIAAALRALREDPLREDVHRDAIRLHLAHGASEAAVRQYGDLESALRAGTGGAPGRETQALLSGVLPSREPAPRVRDRRTPLRPEGSRRPPRGLQHRRARPNNLPCPLTSFIGREQELSDALRLMSTVRMLTLTGPGGCGKSRLAVEIATGLLDTFGDGVWLLDLAPLTGAEPVAGRMLEVLGLRASESGDPALELAAHIGDRMLLLILDNCEHLIDEAARLAERLLQSCPHLRVMATSLEPLGIPGETCCRVPCLPAPDPDALAPGDTVDAYGAVRLFADRAASAVPGFQITDANAAAVARICRRLDGLPLAIEMAAARLRCLPIDEVARRLDDRFHLLTDGSRTDLPRHRTLRGLIDWGCEMLSEPECLLLRRLSVFAVGWTLEAAEAVCAHPGLAPASVIDVLSSLVSRSLIGFEDRLQGSRYTMQETVRQYAAEQLAGDPDAEGLRAAHVRYYAALAAARPAGQAYVALVDDAGNLRAALARCDADPALTGERAALAAALPPSGSPRTAPGA